MEYIYEYYDFLNENKLQNFFKKMKNNKKMIPIIITAMLSYYTVNDIKNNLEKTNLNKETKEIVIKELKNRSGIENKKKLGYKFTLSQDGWDFIRIMEGLNLKAYNLGDGMITIGYGHAEPKYNSKYEEGDKISFREAENLLIRDLNEIAEGVRRIFRQWEKQNIKVKINQNQFDVLVSLAYNCGLTKLRTSDLIQDIKNGNLEKASEKIKTYNLEEKFPGIVKRRIKEYEKFTN